MNHINYTNCESYRNSLKYYLLCRKVRILNNVENKRIDFVYDGKRVNFRILFGSSKFLGHDLANDKDYYPKTYKNEALLEQDKYYFIKPNKGSLGLGINVVKGENNHIIAPDSVIQEKIDSLLYPINNNYHKFDIRYFITYFYYKNKLHILHTDDGIMRFSLEPYKAGNLQSELTNVFQQKKMFNSTFNPLISEFDPSLLTIIPKIQSIVNEILNSATTTENFSQIKTNIDPNHIIFNVIGFDFVVTPEKDVKFIEFNSVPCFSMYKVKFGNMIIKKQFEFLNKLINNKVI